VDLSPQNETKLMLDLFLFYISLIWGGVRTHQTHPLPTGLLLSLFFHFLPSPPFPLEVGPLNTDRSLGERCKLPQWGLGQSPSRGQMIWCILESKSAALLAAVFVDFSENRCNCLHKNKLDIVRRIQFLTGRRPMRIFFSGGSRHQSHHRSRRLCRKL